MDFSPANVSSTFDRVASMSDEDFHALQDRLQRKILAADNLSRVETFFKTYSDFDNNCSIYYSANINYIEIVVVPRNFSQYIYIYIFFCWRQKKNHFCEYAWQESFIHLTVPFSTKKGGKYDLIHALMKYFNVLLVDLQMKDPSKFY